MLQRTALGLLILAAPLGALVLIATDWFPTVAFAIPATMIALSVLILAIQLDVEDALAPIAIPISTNVSNLRDRGR